MLLGHLVELRRIFSHATSNRVVPEGPDQLPVRLRFQITPQDKKVYWWYGKTARQLASRCGTGLYRAGLVVAGEAEQLQHRQEQVQHIQVHANRSHHIVVFFTAHQTAGVVQDEA